MDNKYLFEIENIDSDERREIRRRKRKRKRVVAWITFSIGILILIGAGILVVVDVCGRLGKTGIVSISVISTETPHSATIPDDNGDSGILDDLTVSEDEVVVAPPEEIVKIPSEEELFEEAVRDYVSQMTLEEKVAGIFIVTPEQLTGVENVTRASAGTKSALEKYPVGGIIYSDINMTDQDRFMEMLENTKKYSKYPLFLAINEELGNTSFSDKMNNEETMTPKEIAALCDPSIAYIQEEKIARYMSGLGLNLNIGVVADVVRSDDSIMEECCFGSDVELNAQMVAKTVSALDTYGVDSALKYFPGQGMANRDPETGRSSSPLTRYDFDEAELKVFSEGLDAGAGMLIISHETAPGFSGCEERCSASKYVMTDLIRIELQNDDVVIVTDSLSKSAVRDYEESASACITSIKAGADMVMCPENFEDAYKGVLDAVNKGIIAKERIEDSLVRIYKLKFKDGMPE